MRLAASSTIAAVAALALWLGACGDDETTATTQPTTSNGSSSSSGGGGGPPDASCVRPGDTGNNKGVGEYCTPTGNECADFAEAPLCLASVGQDQWMCTRIGCDAMTDCGDGAGCLITAEGSACVPCRCDDAGIGCAAGGAGGTGGAGGAGATGGAGGN